MNIQPLVELYDIFVRRSLLSFFLDVYFMICALSLFSSLLFSFPRFASSGGGVAVVVVPVSNFNPS